jgi:hypothetical protein
LQKLCSYDKKAYNAHSDALLASHIAESLALKSAFAHAIAEQMSQTACGPLGQSAFFFPQQGPHCLEFLKRCYYNNGDSIPSVRKLVRLAHNLTGINLLIEEKSEAQEEVVEAASLRPPPPPPFSHPSSSFYSLRNLVGCLIAGLAAVEQYRYHHGLDAIKSITACIGFGAGEYAAAVFAGALRLQDAFAAIKAHARAFSGERSGEEFEYEVNIHDDIEGCRSRAIDAVRGALEGTAKEERGERQNEDTTVGDTEYSNDNATISTSTTINTSTDKEENRKQQQPQQLLVRVPRIRIYSGADGVAYESNNATAILNALPYGVCAAHAVAEHRHDVKVALMQQGVAEMVVLVPEGGDDSCFEEEEEEEVVVEREKVIEIDEEVKP